MTPAPKARSIDMKAGAAIYTKTHLQSDTLFAMQCTQPFDQLRPWHIAQGTQIERMERQMETARCALDTAVNAGSAIGGLHCDRAGQGNNLIAQHPYGGDNMPPLGSRRHRKWRVFARAPLYVTSQQLIHRQYCAYAMIV